MTNSLEQAFAEAAKLPPQQQDEIAAFILAELESENRWSMAFADSQDALELLANEALAEHRQGKTKSLDIDKL